MGTSEVLAEIRRIVNEEWDARARPVLLSNLPRSLEQPLGEDYRAALADRSLKSFLQEHAQEAGLKLVQDAEHRARVGVIPEGQQFKFASRPASSAQINVEDARAFGRVLESMTDEEQQATILPTSFVARLLATR